MPGLAFDPTSLAIGGVSTATKLALSGYQALRAGQLKLADTTTPEQREALQIARQRAAFGRLPGSGLAYARLGQAQNTTLQNAMLGAGSGTELLAASAAADRTRQVGELGLAAQGEQYNERAQAGLTQQLGLQTQQRQRDLAAYNQQKSALIGGAIQNAGAAVDTGAAYAAYGLNRPTDVAATAMSTTASPGIRGASLPGYLPGNDYTPGMGLRERYYGSRSNRYGLSY